MDWEIIRSEYETTDITLKALADKHHLKYSTIKSRKQRDEWIKDASSASTTEKDASMKRRGPPKGNKNAAGHGAPKGNKNALGNSGGHGGPYGNDKAVTHGFFRKYLPDDAVQIMEELQTRSPLDMLWDNIMIQYTAIIRAQQIMYVKDKDDITKVLTKSADNAFGAAEEWEYQMAWDKQATFLQAQSRAMGTLQNLIKQYEEMCRQGFADEEQQLRIAALKGKVDEMNKDAKPEVVVFKDDLNE